MADERYSGEGIEGVENESDTDTDGGSLLGSFSLRPRYVLALIGVIVFAALPVVGLSTTQTLVLIGALYFGMFTMSWDMVSGYIGEISFGHALFFTVGGYTSALLNLGYGLSPALTIPAGVLMAAVTGVLIGVPALRIRGPYLSLVTLVAPLILLQIFVIYQNIFGGELGLSQPDGLVTADSFELVAVANYYLALGLFVAIMLGLFLVTRSDAGSVLTAIREDEDAVEAAGLNAAKFKTFAFVLSAAVGGLAGAVFVHTPVGGPRPSQLLELLISIEVLIAAILGGMGTIVGAGLGGVFFYFFNDFLNQQDAVIPILGVGLNEASLLVFAVITMIVLSALPEGVFPWAMHTGRRLYRGASGDGSTADGGGYGTGENPLERTARRYRTAFDELIDATRERNNTVESDREEGDGRERALDAREKHRDNR
jgi:branched-chain amino acid transport system permease protein